MNCDFFSLFFLYRSILYYVDLGTMSAVVPIDLPVKIMIVDVRILTRLRKHLQNSSINALLARKLEC